MSRYSFCIVTNGQFEWACHDTIDCIVTVGKKKWSLAVSRYNTAKAAIQQGRGPGLRYNFCIVTRMRPAIRAACARGTGPRYGR